MMQTMVMELDATDRRLLALVSADGRRAAADLAKELGLSRQAVATRLRGLESRGVIRGFVADVDPATLGLDVQAQVHLVLDSRDVPAGTARLVRLLRDRPQVRAVRRVSGEDCLVVDVVCRSIPEVNDLLARIQATGTVRSSRTAFVLEVLLDRRPLGSLPLALVGP